MKRLLSGVVDAIKAKSIQFIITTSFTLVTVLVVLFVGVMLYSKFTETAEQNAYLNTQQILEQVKYNLDSYLNGTTQIFELVDDKIRRSQGVALEKLTEQLEAIVETRKDIVSIAVFSRTGELLIGTPAKPMRKNSELAEQSWFQSAVADPNNLSFSLPHIQNLFKGEYTWVVSMSRGITIKGDRGDIPAVLLVDVNFKEIDDLCQRVGLGKKGYVYIIDLVGNIVYHPQQQLVYVGLKNENRSLPLRYSYGSYVDDSGGEQRLITIKTVDQLGWKIIGVSYMDEIATMKSEISRFLIWLLCFVFVIVLLLLSYISAKISRPIMMLERSMERVEQGDFTVNEPIRGCHEVEQLSARFHLMMAKVRELMNQIIREQEAKRKSELEVLQAQIHPHFLYNTLNSVVRMVGIGKNEDVITTITSLSKLFRISLSRGKSIITVQEEIEHVRNYLIIQKMRYKQKFEYEIEAREEVLACKTLKLLLQPIVENAIYHGIEPMADPGHIRISASLCEGKLLFVVQDNGLGMPPHVREQVLAGGYKSEGGSGVGIQNVNERIRLTFGEEYGLEIESELEVGTTVKVWLPYLRDDEQEG
ncbi:sensor histidine kinase [Brevibacillus gelatini]|uniref:histidine kinase n=1 Tax=Brevibacillus gelatini TaxID=1655277 RepID=A0A3M8BDE2_9BACL|nr:sensor histidine kinase [Brevibacillus gelatini]RNB61448.1 sensor histidine kinase [Brevibacillus gelatini]